MEHLALYSKNCKRCSLLDPEETKKFKCTPKSGNTECPAQEVQFAVVGKAKRLATDVKAARLDGDINREMLILQEVGKRSKAFQQKFKEWLSK